jgi:ABC-type antimicrobial peptide transport system permease subunit
MSFYLVRILNNKAKYLTIMAIIMVVYFAIHTLFLLLPEMYAEIHPKKVFDIEDVYELKFYTNNRSLLGIEGNMEMSVKFDEAMVKELKNVKGIHSVCLLGVFSPFSEIYGSMKLNDSIRNFMLYGLGEGFEEVLNLEISKSRETVSHIPEIYLESTLAERLNKTNSKLDELEVGDEKSKYAVNGTFHPLGVKDKISNNNLFAGIQKIKESDKILIRLNTGANFEDIEKSVSYLLIGMYGVDQSSFSIYPLNLEGKEEWFKNRNQIVSFFIIGLILLFYVMLALLGLYWNETKSRNVEIGIMRAIGFTRRQVFGLFMKESTIVSAAAIVIAQIIIVNVNPKELKEPKVFFFNIIVSSLVVLSIVWLSVLIPAVKSSQIQPVQALCDE